MNAINKETSELAIKQKKVTNDLQTLLKPQNFFQSYPKILAEISRRNMFNSCLTTDIEVINQVIASEVAERKKFLKQFGDEIPETFVP